MVFFFGRRAFVIVLVACVACAFGESCPDFKTCNECFATFEHCGWCLTTGACENPENTTCPYFYNPQSYYQVTKVDPDFELQPPEFSVYLRPGQPLVVNVSIFNAHLPLELVINSDMTSTMDNDRTTIAANAGILFSDIKDNIHIDSRLGWTSFTEMSQNPFGKMDDSKGGTRYQCDPSDVSDPLEYFYDCFNYGFHLDQPLTANSITFQNKVNSLECHGNRDWPEACTIGLTRTMMCDNEVGWGNRTRKMILMLSDGACHLAGDGFLGNIWKPMKSQCQPEGEFESWAAEGYPLQGLEDYMSIGQLRQMFISKNIFPIMGTFNDWAWPYDNYLLYPDFLDVLTVGTMGLMDSSSSNVYDVIWGSYMTMSESVVLLKQESPVVVSFEPESGVITPTVINGTYDFNITFEWKPHPLLLVGDSWSESMQITALSLGEFHIMAFPLDECDCTFLNTQCPFDCNAPNGTCVCGKCSCGSGWSGAYCNCSTDICPLGIDGTPCGSHGKCVCGSCECESEYSVHYVNGTCDCGKTCSGNLDLIDTSSCEKKADNETLIPCCNHGECVCDVCVCSGNYIGDFCECLNQTCTDDCNGNGECICGKCICDDEHDGDACECSVVQCPGDECGLNEIPPHGNCSCGICSCFAPYTLGPDLDCSCLDEPCPNNCSYNGTTNQSQCQCGTCSCSPSHWGWPKEIGVRQSYDQIVNASKFLVTLYNFSDSLPVEDCSCYNAALGSTECVAPGGAEMCNQCYCDTNYFGYNCACLNGTDDCDNRFGGCVHGECVVKPCDNAYKCTLGTCFVDCICEDGWTGDDCADKIGTNRKDSCAPLPTCFQCAALEGCGWCYWNATGNMTLANGTVVTVPGWYPENEFNVTCMNASKSSEFYSCPWDPYVSGQCPVAPPPASKPPLEADKLPDIGALVFLITFALQFLSFLCMGAMLVTIIFLIAKCTGRMFSKTYTEVDDQIDSINPLYEEKHETFFNPLFQGTLGADGAELPDLGHDDDPGNWRDDMSGGSDGGVVNVMDDDGDDL